MNDFYAGIFVIDLADWKVLAGQKAGHRDLKALGGKSLLPKKPEEVAESPLETAIREVWEEGRTRVLEATLVFSELACHKEFIGWHGTHVKYFFLADKISDALDKEATWEVEVKDDSNTVEKLTTRWVSIAEFSERLFFRQYLAFGAVLAVLANRKQELLQSERFRDLMIRFPKPTNLGLDKA